MKKLKLSIGIATYNHERFIARTLDSVLSQKTSFTYEIVINDDNSEDGTLNILDKYQKANPEKIKLLLQEQNAGPHKSGRNIYNSCTGEYMIWLDGDDYFCNDNKLQTQVDFLDANPDYNGCFHDAEILVDKEDLDNTNLGQFHSDYKYYSQFNHYKPDFHPWDLLERNLIPTASLVFRNKDYSDFFEIFGDIKLSLNWVIQLWIIRHSKFRYFNEVWSVYVDHAKGASKSYEYNQFKDYNLTILERLLKADYYNGMKKDIYKALASETWQILNNPKSQDLPEKEYNKYMKLYKQFRNKQSKYEKKYLQRNYHQ